MVLVSLENLDLHHVPRSVGDLFGYKIDETRRGGTLGCEKKWGRGESEGLESRVID